MLDKAKGPILPIHLRQQLHEIPLNAHGVLVLGKAKAAAEALDVGIDRYPQR
jgi:hypothetical protein